MSEKLQRWVMITYPNKYPHTSDCSDVHPEKSAFGRWVKTADHEALIVQKNTRIKELEKKIVILGGGEK